MTTKPQPPKPPWQAEKRLSSSDKIWILTDIETHSSSFRPGSAEQWWFKVGAYDLRTNCIGFIRFSIDDVRGILRAGLPAAPWNAPLAHGIDVTRLAHEGKCEGRYAVTVKLVDIDPALHSIVPAAKRIFRDAYLSPNAVPGMWKKVVDEVAREKQIEAAALGLIGLFSASDVHALVGAGINVSPVLKRMVNDGRLDRFGKTRGTQYRVHLRPGFVTNGAWTSCMLAPPEEAQHGGEEEVEKARNEEEERDASERRHGEEAWSPAEEASGDRRHPCREQEPRREGRSAEGEGEERQDQRTERLQ